MSDAGPRTDGPAAGHGSGGRIQGRVPVSAVLDRLCHRHGCSWELTRGAEPVLRFTAK